MSRNNKDFNLKNRKIMVASWGINILDHYHRTEWLPFFREFFGKVVIFSPRDAYFKYGKDKMNKIFISEVEKQKPDYLLLGFSYDEFYFDTLKKIKEVSPNTKTLQFFGDDNWRYDDWTRHYAMFIDYNLVAEKESPYYGKDGLSDAYYFHGSSAREFKPLDLKKKYDVVFIGMPIADREEYIKFLRDNGINIKLFGRGWEKYPDVADIYGGYLKQEDYVKMLNQTKINISLSKGMLPGKNAQMKGRVIEIMACKAFGLVEYTPNNIDFLNKNSELTFKTKEELLKKVRYFLENDKEREKYASAAYADFLKNHTWESQFRDLFSKIDGEKPKKFKLPEQNKKIVYLSEEEIINGEKDKLVGADYVGFNLNGSILDKDKDYFQIRSLEKSGKDISCCDYYWYDKKLGDLALFFAKKSFYGIPRDDFYGLIGLSQIVVRKDYFIKNYNKFKSALKEGINFIDDKNTIFVSIPLVRINKIEKVAYSSMEKALQMRFRDRLLSLAHQRKIVFDSYPYRLLIKSFFGNLFILKYLLGIVFNVENWKRMINKSG